MRITAAAWPATSPQNLGLWVGLQLTPLAAAGFPLGANLCKAAYSFTTIRTHRVSGISDRRFDNTHRASYRGEPGVSVVARE